MFTKRHYLSLLFLSITTLMIASCQTVDGAGKDIASAGESIQDSSR